MQTLKISRISLINILPVMLSSNKKCNKQQKEEGEGLDNSDTKISIVPYSRALRHFTIKCLKQ